MQTLLLCRLGRTQAAGPLLTHNVPSAKSCDTLLTTRHALRCRPPPAPSCRGSSPRRASPAWCCPWMPRCPVALLTSLAPGSVQLLPGALSSLPPAGPEVDEDEEGGAVGGGSEVKALELADPYKVSVVVKVQGLAAGGVVVQEGGARGEEGEQRAGGEPTGGRKRQREEQQEQQEEEGSGAGKVGQFPAAKVARQAELRQRAEEACLQHCKEQQQGGTGGDLVQAMLQHVRGAGSEGLSVQELCARISAGAEGEEADAASGEQQQVAPAQVEAAAALLARFGLLLAAPGYEAAQYMAVEHCQRLLVYPIAEQPPQGVSIAQLTDLRAAVAAAAAATQQALPGMGLQVRSAAAAPAPPAPAPAAAQAVQPGASQGSEPVPPPPAPGACCAVIRPWLDHTGAPNLPFLRALVSRALNAALRHPGLVAELMQVSGGAEALCMHARVQWVVSCMPSACLSVLLLLADCCHTPLHLPFQPVQHAPAGWHCDQHCPSCCTRHHISTKSTYPRLPLHPAPLHHLTPAPPPASPCPSPSPTTHRPSSRCCACWPPRSRLDHLVAHRLLEAREVARAHGAPPGLLRRRVAPSWRPGAQRHELLCCAGASGSTQQVSAKHAAGCLEHASYWPVQPA